MGFLWLWVFCFDLRVPSGASALHLGKAPAGQPVSLAFMRLVKCRHKITGIRLNGCHNAAERVTPENPTVNGGEI